MSFGDSMNHLRWWSASIVMMLMLVNGVSTSQSTSSAPTSSSPKIALIAFEQGVFATNEGQGAIKAIQTKWQPKKAEIEQLSADLESLKRQLKTSPATRSAEIQTAITAKEKRLNTEAEKAQADYNSDLQLEYGKVAQKFARIVVDLVQQNGFSALLDISQKDSKVMWANTTTDITVAAVQHLQ